jgi:hypothetical protein
VLWVGGGGRRGEVKKWVADEAKVRGGGEATREGAVCVSPRVCLSLVAFRLSTLAVHKRRSDGSHQARQCGHLHPPPSASRTHKHIPIAS